MEPTPELAARLDWDRYDAARAMTFEQRALGGIVMFDVLVDAMRGIMRVQNPRASAEEIEGMIAQRLRRMREDETIA